MKVDGLVTMALSGARQRLQQGSLHLTPPDLAVFGHPSPIHNRDTFHGSLPPIGNHASRPDSLFVFYQTNLFSFWFIKPRTKTFFVFTPFFFLAVIIWLVSKKTTWLCNRITCFFNKGMQQMNYAIERRRWGYLPQLA